MEWKELAVPFFVYSALVILLVWLWEHQILLSIALLALFVFGQLLWKREAYDWTLYITVVAASLVVEVICVHFGSWTYATPNLINIPSYIPLAYGVGTLALLKIVGIFYRIEPVKAVKAREIFVQIVALVLLIVFMALLWPNSILLAIALLILAIGLSRLWSRSDYDFPFYAVSFLLAPIIDITNIAEGVWKYGSDSIIWNIPLWLPFGYGVGLLLATKISLTVHRILTLVTKDRR